MTPELLSPTERGSEEGEVLSEMSLPAAEGEANKGSGGGEPDAISPTTTCPISMGNNRNRTRARSTSSSGFRLSPYAMASRSSPSPKHKRLPSGLTASHIHSSGARRTSAEKDDDCHDDNVARTTEKQSRDKMDEGDASANNGSSSESSRETPPFGFGARSLGLRRGLAKRGGAIAVSTALLESMIAPLKVFLQARDKSMLRIAATLQDEVQPFNGEVASEARLSKARRLASSATEHPFSSEGKVLGFVVPPSMNARHRSPFVGSVSTRAGGKKTWEEQDDQPDLLDDVAFGVDSGDMSSDDEQVPSMTPNFGPVRGDDMDVELSDIPVSSDACVPSGTAIGHRRRDSKWTDFRETRHASISAGSMLGYSRLSASPSAEKTLMWSKTPTFGPASYGAGEVMDAAVLEELAPPPALSTSWQLAGGNGGRIPKRKALDERFEPYASAQKRRAVSPLHHLSLSIPQPAAIGPAPHTLTSPVTAHTPGSATGSYFPMGVSGHPVTAGQAGRAGTRINFTSSRPGSRASSPALSSSATLGPAGNPHQPRPSTPTTMMPPALSSPALGAGGAVAPVAANHSASGTPKMATTPSAGSGPGYGSGALGLSLGLNHSLYSSPGTSNGSGGPRGLGVGVAWARRDRDEEMQEEAVEEGLSMIGLQ